MSINKFNILNDDSDEEIKNKTIEKITKTVENTNLFNKKYVNYKPKNNMYSNNYNNNHNNNNYNNHNNNNYNNHNNNNHSNNYHNNNYHSNSNNTYKNSYNKQNVLENTNNLEIQTIAFNINNKLQYPLKILGHHINDTTKWEIDDFHPITIIYEWNKLFKFLNTLSYTNGVSSFINYDMYFMKEHITPLWENPHNYHGSICSIKMDTLENTLNLINILLIHLCNNTLLINTNNSYENVNGISHTPKKICSTYSQQPLNYYLIKIWFKTNYSGILVEKFINSEIFDIIKNCSIKITPIKPEY
jgi:hypothetical protein